VASEPWHINIYCVNMLNTGSYNRVD